jgi:predicted protein tyrosine phosphatase
LAAEIPAMRAISRGSPLGVLRRRTCSSAERPMDTNPCAEALRIIDTYARPELARVEIAVRAGVGRGRMPEVLRALMFWSGDWHRTSDWYTWMLTL